MSALESGALDPDIRMTFVAEVNNRPYGYFDPLRSLEVHLDIERIKAMGLYEEILSHEHMHHQLMCSSAFGHATQLAAQLASKLPQFNYLLKIFADISWNSHEGATMLVGFYTHCSRSNAAVRWLSMVTRENDAYHTSEAMTLQADVEKEYLSKYHTRYADPFHMFRFLRNTMLPPRAYDSSTVTFANAVGQFALNTDVLSKISRFLEGKSGLSRDYLNAENNHPDRRLKKLFDVVGADRLSAYKVLAEMMAEKSQLLLKHGITLDSKGSFHLDLSDRAMVTLYQDWLNNVFLEWACRVTGLKVKHLHSCDVADEYDRILARQAKLFRRLGLAAGRFNISSHPDRFDFKPFVKEIP